MNKPNKKETSNPKVIWLTGLSGSGKSTLANTLKNQLEAQNKRTYIIDGDILRLGLCSDLKFSDADRSENSRRAIELAQILLTLNFYVVVALISPFEKDRLLARKKFKKSDFMEIYLSTPLKICEARDVKRLYIQARSGRISNMTGINSTYEIPKNPHLTIDTTNRSISSCINEIITKMDN